MRYVIEMNFPGCLPDGELLYADTLAQARSILRNEAREYLGDTRKFVVETPLRKITRTDILAYGSLVYGSFDRPNDPHCLPIYLCIGWTDESPDLDW